MDLTGLLAGLPHFSELNAGELASLDAAFQVQSYRDGHVFIREGDRADTVFLVVDGEVTVIRERGGREDEVNRMQPGDLFGLVAMIDGGPRSATCRADGPVIAGSLPQTVFTMLFNSNAPIAYAFQRALAAQLARDFRSAAAQIRRALED